MLRWLGLRKFRLRSPVGVFYLNKKSVLGICGMEMASE